MRPQIPDSLEDRIKQVYDSAGYATESELVRDAVRTHLDHLEQQDYTPESKMNTLPELDLNDTGVTIGQHADSNDPLNVDRFSDGGHNHNYLILGRIGYGKTTATKQQIEQEAQKDDTQVVVVDDHYRFYEDMADDVDATTTAIDNTQLNVLEKWVTEPDPRVPGFQPNRVLALLKSVVRSRMDSETDLPESMESVLQTAVEETLDNADGTPTGEDVLSVVERMALSPESYTVVSSDSAERTLEQTASRLVTLLQPITDPDGVGALFTGDSVEFPDEDLITISQTGDARPHSAFAWFQAASIAAENSENQVIIVVDNGENMTRDPERREWLEDTLKRAPHHGVSVHLNHQSPESLMNVDQDLLPKFQFVQTHGLGQVPDEFPERLGLSNSTTQYIKQATPPATGSGGEAAFVVQGEGETRMVIPFDDNAD